MRLPPVFVCADCDTRGRREVLTLGFARPHKCDACGETKDSTEYVWAHAITNEDVRGRAVATREARGHS